MNAKEPPLQVVVAVLTYRRIEALRALLPQLLRQLDEVSKQLGADASVVVVDNDAGRSASGVVRGIDRRIRYVHEETPGIAAGRARAVLEAGSADLIVFIDDDEVPIETWLYTLIRAWLEHQRPAGVAGRVTPTYFGTTDPWIEAGGFFRRPVRSTGTLVDAASSANLALDLHLLHELHLNFDVRLGLRGGEDTALTRTLTHAGHRLVWCHEAEVIDVIPADRMSRDWVLRRAYSHGAVAGRVDIALSSSPCRTRLWLMLSGVIRMTAGSCRAAYGRLTGNLSHGARGQRLAHRGAGLISAALGRDWVEYRRPV